MKNNRAMTLIELMVALVCFVILVILFAITWRHYTDKVRKTAMIYKIKSGLMYARNQAVTQQRSMIYCGSSDLMHCNGDWQNAHIIKDKQTGLVLKSYLMNRHNISVRFYANFGATRALEFTPQGMTYGQQGHFSVCSTRGCKQLLVHFSGEVIS